MCSLGWVRDSNGKMNTTRERESIRVRHGGVDGARCHV